MTSYRVVEPGEVRDPNKNYRVDLADGTLFEVYFEDTRAEDQGEYAAANANGNQELNGPGEEYNTENQKGDPLAR